MSRQRDVRMAVDVVQEAGMQWSVYVNGRRMVDRESWQVAMGIVEELRRPGSRPNSECAEVARSIREYFNKEAR